MDIKGPREKYNKSAGVEVDLEKLQQSIDLVRKSGIEYEFRMTVVPKLHSREDLLSIGEWLQGSSQFFLQQFNSDVPLLDKNLEGSSTYSKEELQAFAHQRITACENSQSFRLDSGIVKKKLGKLHHNLVLSRGFFRVLDYSADNQRISVLMLFLPVAALCTGRFGTMQSAGKNQQAHNHCLFRSIHHTFRRIFLGQ